VTGGLVFGVPSGERLETALGVSESPEVIKAGIATNRNPLAWS